MDLFLRLLSIIILAVVVFFLMRPIRIEIPNIFAKNKKKKLHLTLDMAVIPVLGVIILLSAGSISWSDLAKGIVGDKNLQPYAIVILFFALAYLCLSLDITGIFDYIALKAILSTKGSGKSLFVAVFVLSTLLTVLTSNDIVILTLTQIILSLARFMKSDPLAFLILEFFMANIWSATLFIGNPTNIIVAEAYQLSFLEYSKWMILPTIFGGFTAFGLIWLRFRNSIPENVEVPNLNPEDYLRDKLGGIIGSICLGCCLILLLASSWIKEVPIWAITVFFAGILLVRDIIYDCRNGKTINYGDVFIDSSEFDFLKEKNEKNETKMVNIVTDVNLGEGESPREDVDEQENTEKVLGDTEKDVTVPVESTIEKDKLEEKKKKKANKKHFVTLTILRRLPWKIIPFVISVFIIVEALTVAGWTNSIALGLNMAIGPGNENSNVAISAFLLGSLSSVSCNILNNQPMTILFTRVLEDANFTIAEKPMTGAMFGLILGSNLGANLTFVGALAGIMWSAILQQKGYKLGFFQFALIGITIMPLVILVSCGVIAAEIAIFN